MEVKIYVCVLVYIFDETYELENGRLDHFGRMVGALNHSVMSSSEYMHAAFLSDSAKLLRRSQVHQAQPKR